MTDGLPADGLAEKQAALRRVATLVARGAPPADLFQAVAAELAMILEADFALVGRYEADATLTHLASHPPELLAALGSRTILDGEDLASLILRDARPNDLDYDHALGPVAALARELGVRCAVGAPILVDDQVWGVTAAGWGQPGTASAEAAHRAAEFTELIAMAIANTEAREALRLLADEQAALRRVATLVARGIPSPELFAAVTREVAHVFSGVDPLIVASVIRFDPGPEFVLVSPSRPFTQDPVGSRWGPTELYVSTRVQRTGGSARVEEAELDAVGGPDADGLRARGFLYQVGCPVIVDDRLWGAMTLNSGVALPPDIDQRLMNFTELIATAMANAENRAELQASRARIVAAADATRRQIERDLHDGAQQQLVSLALDLRATQATLPSRLADQHAELSRVIDGLRVVLDELREISSGIHPAILSEGGLVPALRTLARRSPIPVALDVRVRDRLHESVEVAAYYVVAEMLTNAAKHAQASIVHVEVARSDRVIRISIRDDGVGGADPGRGSGLVGLRDRVEALGGTVAVDSPKGEGTAIEVALPLA